MTIVELTKKQYDNNHQRNLRQLSRKKNTLMPHVILNNFLKEMDLLHFFHNKKRIQLEICS